MIGTLITCKHWSSGLINYDSPQWSIILLKDLHHLLQLSLSLFHSFALTLCSFLPHYSSSSFVGSFWFLSLSLTPSLPSRLVCSLPLVRRPFSSWSNFLFRPLNRTFQIPFSAPALVFLQYFTLHFHENQDGRSQKGGSGRMKTRGRNDEDDFSVQCRFVSVNMQSSHEEGEEEMGIWLVSCKTAISQVAHVLLMLPQN